MYIDILALKLALKIGLGTLQDDMPSEIDVRRRKALRISKILSDELLVKITSKTSIQNPPREIHSSNNYGVITKVLRAFSRRMAKMRSKRLAIYALSLENLLLKATKDGNQDSRKLLNLARSAQEGQENYVEQLQSYIASGCEDSSFLNVLSVQAELQTLSNHKRTEVLKSKHSVKFKFLSTVYLFERSGRWLGVEELGQMTLIWEW